MEKGYRKVVFFLILFISISEGIAQTSIEPPQFYIKSRNLSEENTLLKKGVIHGEEFTIIRGPISSSPYNYWLGILKQERGKSKIIIDKVYDSREDEFLGEFLEINGKKEIIYGRVAPNFSLCGIKNKIFSNTYSYDPNKKQFRPVLINPIKLYLKDKETKEIKAESSEGITFKFGKVKVFSNLTTIISSLTDRDLNSSYEFNLYKEFFNLIYSPSGYPLKSLYITVPTEEKNIQGAIILLENEIYKVLLKGEGKKADPTSPINYIIPLNGRSSKCLSLIFFGKDPRINVKINEIYLITELDNEPNPIERIVNDFLSSSSKQAFFNYFEESPQIAKEIIPLIWERVSDGYRFHLWTILPKEIKKELFIPYGLSLWEKEQFRNKLEKELSLFPELIKEAINLKIKNKEHYGDTLLLIRLLPWENGIRFLKEKRMIFLSSQYKKEYFNTMRYIVVNGAKDSNFLSRVLAEYQDDPQFMIELLYYFPEVEVEATNYLSTLLNNNIEKLLTFQFPTLYKLLEIIERIPSELSQKYVNILKELYSKEKERHIKSKLLEVITKIEGVKDPLLINKLLKGEVQERIGVLRGLSQKSSLSPKEETLLLKVIKEDPWPIIRVEASRLLIKNPLNLRYITQLFYRDNSSYVKGEVIKLISSIKSKEGQSLLLRLINQKDLPNLLKETVAQSLSIVCFLPELKQNLIHLINDRSLLKSNLGEYIIRAFFINNPKTEEALKITSKVMEEKNIPPHIKKTFLNNLNYITTDENQNLIIGFLKSWYNRMENPILKAKITEQLKEITSGNYYSSPCKNK